MTWQYYFRVIFQAAWHVISLRNAAPDRVLDGYFPSLIKC